MEHRLIKPSSLVYRSGHAMKETDRIENDTKIASLCALSRFNLMLAVTMAL
jgi:hypothetical protein